MNDTKSKGGRPPRTEEKLQRVTLNLKPSVLFGLELVSRHRRTSLSQAAEYLLLKGLRTYEIDATPVFNSVEETITGLASLGDWTEVDDNGQEIVIPSEERELELQSRMMGNAVGRALLMPESLQSPAERYFDQIVHEILNADWSGHNAPGFVLFFLPEVMDLLFAQAKQFEERNVPAKVAAELLLKMTMLAVDQQAGQTPWMYIGEAPKPPLTK